MLAPYRVLDLTDERVWLAGKILGDLGADVLKVEPPGGDPGRSLGPFLHDEPGAERCLPWLAMNTSKRGIVLDLASGTDRERFLALVRGADVVLESFTPGTLESLDLGYAVLRAENPALVHCAITPFGQRGPRAGYAASDLVVVAMGGNASMTGRPDGAPLRCTMPTSTFHAAPEAALGALMALFARERTGEGQFVDVSMHECQLGTLLTSAGQYALTHRLGHRSGGRMGSTREIWRAKDGWISFGLRGGPARIPNLVATVEYMAECGMAPDWLRELDWQGYSPITTSPGDLERIEAAFGAFFATKSMRELYEEALRRRILLAPCNDAREIVEQAQLRSRGLFRALDYPEAHPAERAGIEHPDFFARASRSRIGIRGPAPRVGEHQDEVLAELSAVRRLRLPEERRSAAMEKGVFEGLRILELGSGAAGPVATRYFAEQGARVIRIESGVRPDFLRLLHVTAQNRDEPGILEKAPMFALLNPNKESLTLNMKEPEAVEIVKRLAAWADVVSENFAPGVMAKWGLEADALRAESPRLIVVSGCLFGQTGPQRSYPGFGGQGSAIAGFNHLTGQPDSEAHGPYATITDSLAPRYVAVAIAGALLERERSGEGQVIDVSQIETGVYSLSQVVVRYSANRQVETRRGNAHEFAAPHGVYPCAGEDRWIAISVFADDAWERLAGALGSPGWASDLRFASGAGRLAAREELDARLAECTRARDGVELMDALQAAGVEAGVVQDFADLQNDPQLAAREHFVTLEHEALGALRFERSGFRLSASPGGFERAGPTLGQHNREILGGLLGFAPAEIDRMIAAKVVA